MKFGTKNSSITKKASIGKIRKAQLITTFGPGAIAEMPYYTVIMGTTDYWDPRSKKIYEPNLQKLLGVKYFKEPYTSESEDPKGNPDIPAFRFPRMHFCPSCGRLDDYKNFGDPKRVKCITCKKELIPSRFVVACVNGHLEDFPFEWWVHYGNPYDCKEPHKHNKLKIEFKNNTGGLASIVIKCEACGKERSMEGCMSKNALKGYKCRGKRPWIGIKDEYNDPEPCDAPMRALQRGASNLYYAKNQSALTIPPWSNKLVSLIKSSWEKFQVVLESNVDDAVLEQVIKFEFNSAIATGRYSVEDFLNGIKKLAGFDTENTQHYTEQRMYEDEYKALCEGYCSDDADGETSQFVAEIAEIDDDLTDYFDEIVLVKRLREVMALCGFRRITPATPSEGEEASEGSNANEFTPPWNKQQCWLPAIEMRGEGVFIRLNAEKLMKWENDNAGRYEDMRARLGNLDIDKGMFSARFVLLHTLSHLLIRQLTIDCGYQEAALKERIYSTYPDSDLEMCGILIYTSSSDSDGSLGGLVRQGEPDLLKETIENMLQEASWCSSDPLCIESVTQGYNSLNYAACHACTLLPETSCVARNCLLDRVSIIGKPGNRELGFFGDVMEDK